MKKFMILALVLCAVAFSQSYRVGAFYGDIAITSTNTPTLIGYLPPNAVISTVNIGWGVLHTNVTPTTSNYLQVGIASQTNYFVASTNMPPRTYNSTVVAVSNSHIILSSRNATPIYGYQTRLGGAVDSLAGTLRVIITYVQK
jgi:hypothetical protein